MLGSTKAVKSSESRPVSGQELIAQPYSTEAAG